MPKPQSPQEKLEEVRRRRAGPPPQNRRRLRAAPQPLTKNEGDLASPMKALPDADEVALADLRLVDEKAKRAIAARRMRKLLGVVASVLLILAIIVIAYANLESFPKMIGLIGEKTNEVVQKIVPNTVTTNGVPQQQAPSGVCQTFVVASESGGYQIDRPVVSDSPSSWCPSDTNAWKELVAGSRDQLATDIASDSKVDPGLIPAIQVSLDQSVITGRLELPGKLAPAPAVATPTQTLAIDAEAEPPPAAISPTEVTLPTPEPPTPEPVIPTVAPTEAPTPIAYLIDHQVEWSRLGDFMARYKIASMSGSVPCKQVDMSQYPLRYGLNPEDYVITKLLATSWSPLWPAGAIDCPISVRREAPLFSVNWAMVETLGHNPFWASPFVLLRQP